MTMDLSEIKEKYPSLKMNQIYACYLLSLGRKKSEVIREVKISYATIYRWLDEEQFVELHKELCQKHMFDLNGTYNKALDKMNEMLESDSEKSVLGAAKLIMQEYHKAREMESKTDDILKVQILNDLSEFGDED